MITARWILMIVFIVLSIISGIIREIVKDHKNVQHKKDCEFSMIAFLIAAIIVIFL